MAGCCWQFWHAIDINTYYYSFSTISQTRAGAFAFLVAVALFRMQSIENEMERAFGEVIRYAGTADNQSLLQMINRLHDWHDVDKYISEAAIDAHPQDEIKSVISTNWNSFKLGRENIVELKSELVGTLRLTSVVIGWCLAAIPLCQLLRTSPVRGGPFAAMIFLLGTIVLAFWCLWRYYRIAKHLTDRKPRHIYASARN
jgi:hypothetical protein